MLCEDHAHLAKCLKQISFLILCGALHLQRCVRLHCIQIDFLRSKAECFARLCHRLGVCPSVCPSVTLVSCIKTVQARITKSSLCAALWSLVYRDKISCHWVQGFSNEGVEEGYPPKRRHFAVIGSNNVKTVADRYIPVSYTHLTLPTNREV